MNKKQLLLPFLILFLTYASVSIAEKLDEGASEAWIMGRLHAVNELLQYERTPKERAELLYEKADLMYQAYKPRVSLRILTECLIETIELDPENKKYKEYLRKIYETEWKDRYFHGEDGYSNNLIQLRNKVESYLKR